MLKEKISMIRVFFEQMRKQDINAYASSMAFFLFLSLVPMLIVICTMIPYTPLTQENLVLFFTDFTPDAMDPMVENLIAEVYDQSAGILSVAILATIWSAGKAVLALMRGLNAIYDVEEERNYFVVRFLASLYTLVMLLVVIISLVLMVFGNRLVDLVLHRIPQLEVVVSFLMNFRFVLVWVVFTILFGMIYAYIPNIHLKFREQLTGAMFTAIVWNVFSWGFSMYVDFGGVGSVYGSLTMIVLGMVWMYCCMYIVLVGAFLNRYFGLKGLKGS